MAHSEDFILEMKVLLENKKVLISKELAESSGEMDGVFQRLGSSQDENILEVSSFSDRLSLSNTLEKTLSDIEKALLSMSSGVYGQCKYCDADIPEARLRARTFSSSWVGGKKELKGED